MIPPNNPIRMYMLDDDEADIRLVERLLEKIDPMKYKLRSFSKPRNAVPKLLQWNDGLLMLDYQLPRTNGLKVLRTLRKKGFEAPIVMLTGRGSEELAIRVTREGGNGYLSKKGLDVFTLKQCLDRILAPWNERNRCLQEIEQLKHEARHDQLTGLSNRWHFFRRLENEIERALKENTPLSLSLLDVDEFKKINDQFGHLAGDKLLGKIGKIVAEETLPEDCAGRFGGDEFCILMPRSSLTEARERTDAIRRRINHAVMELEDGQRLHATVSLGVSVLDESTSRQHVEVLSNQLLNRADRALYTAKRRGGNRVERRKQPRRSIRPMDVQIVTLDGTQQVEMVEYSSDGMLLMGDQELKPGTYVFVKCPENDYMEDRFVGIIRWCRPEEKNRYCIGLEMVRRGEGFALY